MTNSNIDDYPPYPRFNNQNHCPICNNHVDSNYISYDVSDVDHNEYHKALAKLMSSTQIPKEYLVNNSYFSMGTAVQHKICEKCKLYENTCICKKIILKKGRSVGASTDSKYWYKKEKSVSICKPICLQDIQDLKKILDDNETKEKQFVVLDSINNLTGSFVDRPFYFGHEYPELMKLPGGQSWLELMLSNKKELNKWLETQYHDCIKSAERIEYYSFPTFLELDPLLPEEYKQLNKEKLPKHKSWVKTIISQKKLHAKWIGELLNKNGIDSTVLQDDQFWNWKNIPDRNLIGFEQFCSLCENYEHISQNKITIFAENEFVPKELKNIFKKILKQKQFHIKAFREMAGNECNNAEKLIKEFNLRK